MWPYALYVFLLAHFACDVLYTMGFAAFLSSASGTRRGELIGYFYLGAFSLAELIFCVWALASGHEWALFRAIPWLIVASIAPQIVLKAFGKCDLSLWVPFCLGGFPLLTYPALPFLWLFYDKLASPRAE